MLDTSNLNNFERNEVLNEKKTSNLPRFFANLNKVVYGANRFFGEGTSNLAFGIPTGKGSARNIKNTVKEINEATLMDSGVIRRRLDGVRLIGGGEFKSKINIKISSASNPAIALVEKLGGAIVIEETTKVSGARDSNQSDKSKNN